MTITVPVAIPAAGLPLPDPTDKTTFSARKLEQLRWANNEYSTYSYNLGVASYNNAQDAASSAVLAATNAAGVTTNATLAAQYAGATAFVPGSTYAQYAVVFSTTNQRSYRKMTAGSVTLSTDPASDSTNWKIINIARPVVIVGTSAVSALAGFDYLLTFAGAVTVTAMASPAADDTFGILIANGRADNVLNPNGNTVHGIAGNLTIDDAYASVVSRFLNSTYRVSKAS